MAAGRGLKVSMSNIMLNISLGVFMFNLRLLEYAIIGETRENSEGLAAKEIAAGHLLN